jgi:transcriptional regulator with XRE-family HTH domain
LKRLCRTGLRSDQTSLRLNPLGLSLLAWDREHPEPIDRERFAREVAPKLCGLSARTLARATGLSVSHWSKVKRGERVPHPRLWAALAELG